MARRHNTLTNTDLHVNLGYYPSVQSLLNNVSNAYLYKWDVDGLATTYRDVFRIATDTPAIVFGNSTDQFYLSLVNAWHQMTDLSGSPSAPSAGTNRVYFKSGVAYKRTSAAENTLVAGPTSATSGNLPSFSGTSGGLVADSAIAAANVVTAASNFTDAELIQAAGANKTISSSGILTANVPTMSANAGGTGRIIVSAGSNKTQSASTVNLTTDVMDVLDDHESRIATVEGGGGSTVYVGGSSTLPAKLRGGWLLNEVEGPRADILGHVNLHEGTNWGVPSRASPAGIVANIPWGIDGQASNFLQISNFSRARTVWGLNSGFSLTAWIQLDAVGAYAPILAGNSSGGNYCLFFGVDDTNHATLLISGDGTGLTTVATAATMSINTLYFLHAKYDGSNITVSINAGTVATASYSAGLFARTLPFYLGGSVDGGDYPADAYIGQVMVWDPLDEGSGDEDIDFLYNAGAGVAIRG